jgi:hypothetical protein
MTTRITRTTETIKKILKDNIIFPSDQLLLKKLISDNNFDIENDMDKIALKNILTGGGEMSHNTIISLKNILKSINGGNIGFRTLIESFVTTGNLDTTNPDTTNPDTMPNKLYVKNPLNQLKKSYVVFPFYTNNSIELLDNLCKLTMFMDKGSGEYIPRIYVFASDLVNNEIFKSDYMDQSIDTNTKNTPLDDLEDCVHTFETVWTNGLKDRHVGNTIVRLLTMLQRDSSERSIDIYEFRGNRSEDVISKHLATEPTTVRLSDYNQQIGGSGKIDESEYLRIKNKYLFMKSTMVAELIN